MRRSLLAAITLILAWVLGSVSSASSSSRHGRGVRGCDLFASPTGSDRHGHGTFRRPFKSAAKLDRKLLPGETGCLRGGTYGSTRSLHRITSSGSPTARITIRSVPGETATIRGYVYVGGSYTTLSYLRIDGSNRLRSAIARGCHSHVSQPLIIAGHDDVLEYDNYFQSIPDLRGNGIGIGFWGRADNTMIRYSKIHDVGQCKAEDHLIYLARGNNVQIYDNWLWNDAHGRGVQLYPGPTNARIFNNVIDRAGEGFVVGNEPGVTIAGNQIFHNIISNSRGLPWERIPAVAIHDLYGGARGKGNTFHDNDAYHNAGGIGRLIAVRSYGNLRANPHFANAARHNYLARESVPFVSWQVWTGS